MAREELLEGPKESYLNGFSGTSLILILGSHLPCSHKKVVKFGEENVFSTNSWEDSMEEIRPGR